VSPSGEKALLSSKILPALSLAMVRWFFTVAVDPSARILVHSVVTVAENEALVRGKTAML
jgi:hypothetical protein